MARTVKGAKKSSGLATTPPPERANKVASLLAELAELMRQDDFGKEARHHLRQLQMRVRFHQLNPQPEISDVQQPEAAPTLWVRRADKNETPADFIRREYAKWLGHGLTRADIRRLDMGLYDALKHWLRENELPADVPLPTRTEVIEKRLSQAGNLSFEHTPEQREKLQLYHAARRRARKKGS